MRLALWNACYMYIQYFLWLDAPSISQDSVMEMKDHAWAKANEVHVSLRLHQSSNFPRANQLFSVMMRLSNSKTGLEFPCVNVLIHQFIPGGQGWLQMNVAIIAGYQSLVNFLTPQLSLIRSAHVVPGSSFTMVSSKLNWKNLEMRQFGMCSAHVFLNPNLP